jgi:hypothetical protein
VTSLLGFPLKKTITFFIDHPVFLGISKVILANRVHYFVIFEPFRKIKASISLPERVLWQSLKSGEAYVWT